MASKILHHLSEQKPEMAAVPWLPRVSQGGTLNSALLSFGPTCKIIVVLAHVLLSCDHVFSTPMDISMLCVTCATSAGPAVWPIPTVTENSDAALVAVVSDVPVVRATPTILVRGCCS